MENDMPAGATRYSDESIELLQLLKQGKKPVIASGCVGDNPNVQSGIAIEKLQTATPAGV